MSILYSKTGNYTSYSGYLLNEFVCLLFFVHPFLSVRIRCYTTITQTTLNTVIMTLHASLGDFPLLIEAKSAGDFTNTNKRRKEEVAKISQLQRYYGINIRFIMFLCGYFDTGYLGYEAAEGIDWVWEHRIDDLAEFGV